MWCGWKGKGFRISNKLAINLDNYVKGVLEKNTSAVFICDGRSGLGKTTFSSQLGCYIAKKVAEWKDKNIPLQNGKEHERRFSLDDMSWTPQQIIDGLKDAELGDIRIMDEAMIFSSRSAMSEFNKAIIMLMAQIRSKQIFVIFNVNSIFDLDRNLALHRADMLCHLYAAEDKFAARGRYFVIPSTKGYLKDLYVTGKKYYSYSKGHSVHKDHFSDFFPFNEKEYERRKQKAIQEFLLSDKSESSKTRESRDLYIKHLKSKKYSNKKIGKIGNISKNTVLRALAK